VSDHEFTGVTAYGDAPPIYALGRNRARLRSEVTTASTAKPACSTANIQPTT